MNDNLQILEFETFCATIYTPLILLLPHIVHYTHLHFAFLLLLGIQRKRLLAKSQIIVM